MTALLLFMCRRRRLLRRRADAVGIRGEPASAAAHAARGAGATAPARIAANHVRGEQALAVMEQQLAAGEWLAAERCCTIADIALYAYTHTAAEGGFDPGVFPASRRWLERVRVQPGHIAQMRDDPNVAVARWPGRQDP